MLTTLIEHLRTAAARDGAGLTDAQLLGRFVERRDEAAFAALVRRHGPMVWGVCRRLLRDQDAEDAFQATFLVLVRKAAVVAPREMVANWLYGVARQTALQARRAAARRREREKQVANMPELAATEQDAWHGLQHLLDQELARLPDKYRAVVVLCDLEGRTRKEASAQLGLPDGTVAGRLARARALLAKRLTRRGVALSAGALAALAETARSACVPASAMCSTIRAATLVAAGQATAAGVISAPVAALTEGVLNAMFLTKPKIAAAVAMIVVSLTGGAGLIYQTQAAQDATGQERQVLASQRANQPAGEKGGKTPELQRRVAELEKQVRSLTSEVRALQKKLDAPATRPPAKTEARVFQLGNSNADEVSQMLWDMFRKKVGSEMHVGKDSATNALIVVASPNDLSVIEAIVTQLGKLPKQGQNQDRVAK